MRKSGLMLIAGGIAFGGCFNPSETGMDTDGGSTSAATTTTAGTSVTAGTSASTSGTTTTDTTTSAGTSAGSESSTSGSETTSESTGEGVELLECVEALLNPATGTPVATIDTLNTDDGFTGTCGGMGSNDAAYQWIAPFDDYFIFDTQGSEFDTVLYVLDATCDGEELGCHDNIEGGVSSRLVLPFEEGQQAVVVVDGALGAEGPAALNIERVTCPAADLTGVALPQTFSNLAGTNLFSSSCGGGGGLERTFRFVAPGNGLYSFKATSSEFAPVVSVQAGPICGGPDLQCNASPGAVGAEVIRHLDAGDVVTVIVDSGGGSGEFDLDIVDLELSCPHLTLASSFAGDLNSFDHRMTTSCAPAGESFSMDATLFDAATFSWTSPGMVGSSSGCNIIYTGGFPASISLQEGGTCSGAELQCDPSTINASNNGYEASVTVGHIPPTEFTITVVQSAQNLVPLFGTDFDIEVLCFAIG